MYKWILLILFLILLEKTLIYHNLGLIPVIYLAIRERSGTIPISFLAGVTNDILNNFIVGSSLLGFGIVFLQVCAYKKMVSKTTLKENIPLLISSIIIWQLTVQNINRIF